MLTGESFMLFLPQAIWGGILDVPWKKRTINHQLKVLEHNLLYPIFVGEISSEEKILLSKKKPRKRRAERRQKKPCIGVTKCVCVMKKLYVFEPTGSF